MGKKIEKTDLSSGTGSTLEKIFHTQGTGLSKRTLTLRLTLK